MDTVAIIIINWNTGNLLSRCLQSIEALSERGDVSHIVVVDNNSSDDSMALARRVGASVEFIELDENVGFAKGNNKGIEHVKSLGGDGSHILLLNPDTEVFSGSIRNMVGVLERKDDAGIVGAKLLNSDKSIQESVRAFPSFFVFVFLFLKLHRVFPFLPFWRRYMMSKFAYSEEAVVDQVMGAAFLIRREVVVDVGLLDERFWIWFEEVDYCKRAINKGWEVWYTPSAQCIHFGGVSFGQLIGFNKTVPWLKSMLRYASKHMSRGFLLTLYLLSAINLVLAIPASIAHLAKRK